MPLRVALTGQTPRPGARAAAQTDAARHRAPPPGIPCSKSIIRSRGEKEEFKPLRAERGAHVRVRHDRVRLHPHRPCAHADGVRSGAALPARAAATRSPTCATSPTSTTRSSSARRENGEDWRGARAALHRGDARGLRARSGLQPPDVEPRATEYIGAIIAMTQTLIDKGYAYVAANGDVMYAVRKFAGLRRAVGQEDRRSARRLAGAGRRVQARSAGFRAVETRQARRAVLAVALGRGPARVAHRMLGHVHQPARQLLRHARRRHGPEIPASRERDRAVLRGLRHAVRPRVDAQRLRAHQRREDVEVARQFLHRARRAEDAARSGSAAVLPARQPLPRADQLFRGAARTRRTRRCSGCIGRSRTRRRARLPPRRRRCARSARRSRASTRPWTTTSTRRRRWR